MISPRHAAAILAVGFTELPAWGQAPVAGTTFRAPGGTPYVAAAPSTTAVAAFPDVVVKRPLPARDEMLDLLATDPYAAELSFREAQRNLFGDALEDEDPYSEALRLVNPYARSDEAPPTDDLSNPYATARRGSAAR